MRYQTRDKTYPLANLKPVVTFPAFPQRAADKYFKNAHNSQIGGDFERQALACIRHCRQGVYGQRPEACHEYNYMI
jgi:hypothetical protein